MATNNNEIAVQPAIAASLDLSPEEVALLQNPHLGLSQDQANAAAGVLMLHKGVKAEHPAARLMALCLFRANDKDGNIRFPYREMLLLQPADMLKVMHLMDQGMLPGEHFVPMPFKNNKTQVLNWAVTVTKSGWLYWLAKSCEQRGWGYSLSFSETEELPEVPRAPSQASVQTAGGKGEDQGPPPGPDYRRSGTLIIQRPDGMPAQFTETVRRSDIGGWWRNNLYKKDSGYTPDMLAARIISRLVQRACPLNVAATEDYALGVIEDDGAVRQAAIPSPRQTVIHGALEAPKLVEVPGPTMPPPAPAAEPEPEPEPEPDAGEDGIDVAGMLANPDDAALLQVLQQGINQIHAELLAAGNKRGIKTLRGVVAKNTANVATKANAGTASMEEAQAILNMLRLRLKLDPAPDPIPVPASETPAQADGPSLDDAEIDWED